MNPQLMALLEIQDLRSKVRELEEEPSVQELEREHFHVDTDEAVRRLDEKIADLEDGLDRRVRSRYDRIAGRMDRVVVPVLGGVCYGCFMSVATAVVGDQDPNEELQGCENCGCFLYFLS